MAINWNVRFANPTFWVGIVGVLGTIAIEVANVFGVDLTAIVGQWTDALSALVTAVFAVLALVGVTADPTTKGVSDSEQAMTYETPKEG